MSSKRQLDTIALSQREEYKNGASEKYLLLTFAASWGCRGTLALLTGMGVLTSSSVLIAGLTITTAAAFLLWYRKAEKPGCKRCKMDIFLFAASNSNCSEHDLAYRLLTLAVGRVFGLNALPDITREAGGKPFFPGRPDICFNLSHSHGTAVCAVHNRPVGIDIEKLRPAPKRLANGMEDEAFFRLWTAKEATIKRQGLGVDALLRPMEPDPMCRCVEGLLDGYIVTVCPSENAEIVSVKIDSL